MSNTTVKKSNMLDLKEFDLNLESEHKRLREFLEIPNEIIITNELNEIVLNKQIDKVGWYSFNTEYKINGKVYNLQKTHRVKEFKENYLNVLNKYSEYQFIKTKAKLLSELINDFCKTYQDKNNYLHKYTDININVASSTNTINYEFDLTYYTRLRIYITSENKIETNFYYRNNCYFTKNSVDKELKELNEHVNIAKEMLQKLDSLINSRKEQLTLSYVLK